MSRGVPTVETYHAGGWVANTEMREGKLRRLEYVKQPASKLHAIVVSDLPHRFTHRAKRHFEIDLRDFGAPQAGCPCKSAVDKTSAATNANDINLQNFLLLGLCRTPAPAR